MRQHKQACKESRYNWHVYTKYVKYLKKKLESYKTFVKGKLRLSVLNLLPRRKSITLQQGIKCTKIPLNFAEKCKLHNDKAELKV